MLKPEAVFDRDEEWAALARFAADERPGTRLAVVRGRRRHGKSVLLRALAEQTAGLYYQALEATATEQLRDLGQVLAQRHGLAAPLELVDWSRALEAALAPSSTRLVVLDEFPYLVQADPSLPSALQRWLDAHRTDGPPVRLVICGSALSVMSQLLLGSAPLRGRASVELPVRAFDHVRAREFHRISDPLAAVAAYAVVGGVPGYAADLLDGDLPADRGDVGAWMVRAPLSTGRPLLYEARHVLDEPAVRDRASYSSVLAAVARGATTNGAIAGALRRSSASVAHALAVLEDLELVRRREDPLRGRRPTWSLADPLVRWWAAVLRPDWARLEQGRADEVWRDAQPRWRARVLGPLVEDLARAWAEQAVDVLGPLRQVGAAVINDPRGRVQHEVDVVGLDARSEQPRVAVLGEAKAGRAGRGALHRLTAIRELLRARGLADDDTKLAVIGLEGVDPGLRAPHVELVDADRLYRP